MTKGLARSISRGPAQQRPITKAVVKVSNVPILVDGAAGVGFGSAVVGDLPSGNILFLGAVAYLAFNSAGGQAGLSDTWNGDFGVGTTPASDATLTAGDVDIVPSTAVGPATAEDSPRTRGAQADGALAGAIFDNTDGSLELNVSLLIDDADISADDVALTIAGEIHLAYIVLGDD